MAIYVYKCVDCNKEFEHSHPMVDHPIMVKCHRGGVGKQLIRSVAAIVPYEFKSVKPFTPEVCDVKRETEEVCRKKGWNPAQFLDNYE